MTNSLFIIFSHECFFSLLFILLILFGRLFRNLIFLLFCPNFSWFWLRRKVYRDFKWSLRLDITCTQIKFFFLSFMLFICIRFLSYFKTDFAFLSMMKTFLFLIRFRLFIDFLHCCLVLCIKSKKSRNVHNIALEVFRGIFDWWCGKQQSI